MDVKFLLIKILLISRLYTINEYKKYPYNSHQN